MRKSFLLFVLLLFPLAGVAEGTRATCFQYLSDMIFHDSLERLSLLSSRESKTAIDFYHADNCSRLISREESNAIIEQGVYAFSRRYGMRRDDGTTINLNPQTCQVAKDMLAYPWTWVLSGGDRR